MHKTKNVYFFKMYKWYYYHILIWFQSWKNPLRVSFPGSSLLCFSHICNAKGDFFLISKALVFVKRTFLLSFIHSFIIHVFIFYEHWLDPTIMKGAGVKYKRCQNKVWAKKTGHAQKLAINKKSTIFVQFCSNSHRLIIHTVYGSISQS